MMDTSVRKFGIAGQFTNEVLPGIENRLVVFKTRGSREESEDWLQSQINCLPAIARLLREGLSVWYTYSELRLEIWRLTKYPHMPFGDVFSGVHSVEVQSAIRRAILLVGYSDNLPEKLQKICEWLVSCDVIQLTRSRSFRSQMTDFEAESLEKVDGYRSIVDGIDPKHWRDAFHLWSAERNDIPFFLTADRKFINAITKDGKKKLGCTPISPSDYLNMMGVDKRDEFCFEPGNSYLLNGRVID